jgi:hypothetical protein
MWILRLIENNFGFKQDLTISDDYSGERNGLGVRILQDLEAPWTGNCRPQHLLVLCFEESRVVLEDFSYKLHGIFHVILQTSQCKLSNRTQVLELPWDVLELRLGIENPSLICQLICSIEVHRPLSGLFV